jgi:A/G-specific adenine glycosylase
VASISFGDRAAVVDGNVVRVLTRLVGLRSTFATPVLAVRRVTDLAGELLDPRHPGDHNQAMMELGSQVCRKAAPACEACPVRTFCNSRGKAERIPSFIPRKAHRETVDRILLIRAGKVLLQRHARDRTRLAGMAELPLAASLGINPEGDPLATRRRTIALTTYEERIHRAPAGLKVPRGAGWEWVKLADLPFAALAGPHLRWISELKTNRR